MFLAVISAPSLIWLSLVAALGVFIVWRVQATATQARANERERELAMLASLPATATLSLVSEITPTLDALVLPGDPVPADVDAGRGEGGASAAVDAAAEALAATAQAVRDAGASGGDVAAAAVLREALEGPAIATLRAVPHPGS